MTRFIRNCMHGPLVTNPYVRTTSRHQENWPRLDAAFSILLDGTQRAQGLCHVLPVSALSRILIPHHRGNFIAVLFPTTDLLVFTRQKDYTHPRTSFLKAACETTKVPPQNEHKKHPYHFEQPPNLSKLSKCGNFTETFLPESRKSFRRDVQPWSWQVWMQLHQRPHCFADWKSQPGVGSSSHLFMRVFDHYQVDWWIDADFDIYNHVYIYICIYNLYIVQYMYTGLTLGLKSQKKTLTENDHDFSQSLRVFPRSALATRSCASSDFMSSSSSKFLLFNRSTTLTKTPTKKKTSIQNTN